MMPRMNGFEFIAQLRQTTGVAHHPNCGHHGESLSEEDRLRLNGFVTKILEKRSGDARFCWRKSTNLCSITSAARAKSNLRRAQARRKNMAKILLVEDNE